MIAVMNNKTIGDAIKRARKSKGFKQEALANEIGWGQGRLSHYESGRREPKIDDIRAIERVLKVDILSSLNIDEPQKFHDITNVRFRKSSTSVHEPIADYSEEMPVEVWDNDTPMGDDDVFVPYYMDIELAAGDGANSSNEKTGAKLKFGRSFFRRKGVEPENAKCVRVKGNSMEPRLNNGDTVAIDTGFTKVNNGDTYAINHDGLLRLKRLYNIPGGGIKLVSYNSDEHPEEVYTPEQRQDIRIIGRVFHSQSDW